MSTPTIQSSKGNTRLKSIQLFLIFVKFVTKLAIFFNQEFLFKYRVLVKGNL